MKITRKKFLKSSSLLAAAFFNTGLFLIEGCKSIPDKLKATKKISGICPFCSMGCGITASVRNGKIINIEGNPDHPINEGRLCAKGNAVIQLGESNRKRLDKVLHREPFSSGWKEISWEEALKKIAQNIKSTRDRTFVEIEDNTAVNRTSGIAVMGGSMLLNEEAYLLSKMSRLLGITDILDESGLKSSVPAAAVSSSLGYPAMSNHWTDIQNSDAVIIIGSNPAENHPVSIKHILKAKENGSKIIHIDPRFTRTSSIADYYMPVRPGTDIAFIGGIINYAILNNRINKKYITEYTNASYIINGEYDFNNGIFSGFRNGKYNNAGWNYEKDRKGVPITDKTLNNKNTAFRIIKTHFSRYTPDAVSYATGCSPEKFIEIADIITSTFKPEKSACILFSSGLMQHTTCTQNIRALIILQLLLGNIGIKGGGINFLRSGSNEQGCSDNGICRDFLPGYLPVPDAKIHPDLASYIKNTTPVTNDPMSINSLSRMNVYVVNLLKSYYGNNASDKSYFCYDWLPKRSRYNHDSDIFEEILRSNIEGIIISGANPIMNIPDSGIKAKSLEKLNWMIVTDIFENETASFWKADGFPSEKIKTEVFLLPAASLIEKSGSITNSGRWIQWTNKMADPPGDARPDLWIFDAIFKNIRDNFRSDIDTFFPDPIIVSNWSYSNKKGGADPVKVSKEINGINQTTGKQVPGLSALTDDGSTGSGNWLYCGSFTEAGNLMGKADNHDYKGLKQFPEWAWAWPGNTRVLFNRAGVGRDGIPWNDDDPILHWDGEWNGDNPDGHGLFGPGEKNPFVMIPEGVARLFDMDIPDGPLPEHYEPVESPVNNIFNTVKYNPCVFYKNKNREILRDKKYPYIATTYKIAGAWKPGIYSKNMPWIAELVPDNICEISITLGDSLGLKTGDKVKIISRRGSAAARCIVTERLMPFVINDRSIEMVAVVLNSGHENPDNNVNRIFHDIGDPVVNIPETKAFMVDIRGI